VSKLIQGQLHLFATKLSSINLSEVPPSSSTAASSSSTTSTSINAVTVASAASTTKRAILRKEAVEILKDLEKKEQQLFATIIELLNLRLRMMIAQREEVEDREILRAEMKEYQMKEASVLHDLNSLLDASKQQFDKDLSYQLNKYQRQLHKSTKKLSVLETFDQRKATEQKDMKLLLKLQASQTRYERLCERHDLELEGYASEAQALKNKLKYAQRAMKLML
jgi:hypothetical protein